MAFLHSGGGRAALAPLPLLLWLGAGPALAQQINYPQPDATLGEVLGPTEIADATALAETLSDEIRKTYVNGQARRDAHPKSHGCVHGTFRVRPDLPADLQAGLFRPGAEYAAVVRFSNGSPNAAGDDHTGDTRGMATKLYGVAGDKLAADPAAPDAHDFIQISSPYFFVNDSHGYTEFFQRVDSGSLLAMAKIPFILGWSGTINAAHMLGQKIDNPLDVTYYSVTPYQFGLGEGRRAVKYSATPCTPPAPAPADGDEGPNFLRHAMQGRLAQMGACFDFRLQLRPDDSFAVEDVITEWDETAAPFVTVATLTIPPQTFDTAAQNATCEALSFNPWHALPDHKPLGTINRMRRFVYETISALRHQMNDTPPSALRGDVQ